MTTHVLYGYQTIAVEISSDGMLTIRQDDPYTGEETAIVLPLHVVPHFKALIDSAVCEDKKEFSENTKKQEK